jgi:NAD(P)-dependent dehydrogenase (short-subunit alcohol dehydrogenase family)
VVDSLGAQGKVVIVTGGSRGVGRGIAESFLARGATVVVCGRNEPDDLPAASGATATFLAGDVRDAEQVDAIVAGTVERFGRIDVVVNNAGGTPPALVAEVSPRFITSIISLNLVAPLLVARAANAVMQAQDEGGSIINISSVNGVRPSPGSAPYGAAKAGLLNATQSLAVEFAPKVRVNAVTAGTVATDELLRIYYGGDEERIAAFSAQIPLGRMADPSDVGSACVYLASPLARHVTGSNLLVHGGGEPAASMTEPS